MPAEGSRRPSATASSTDWSGGRQPGYDNARVSDICHAAGVTRPAFYALFSGKQDAFLAAYRHGIAVVSHLMEDAYRDAGPDWPQAARAALRTLLDVLASVPAFARMALVEVDAAGPTPAGSATRC
ncbi:TetR/AcrR family transcriptional regulator [Micromonospora sp. BRA006-A]|nr:TetR/AcrR family transcriptional regulator [Micromonospora sp. BRA006-A]